MGDEPINRQIAQFYDTTSSVWEGVYGEHMHQAWFDPTEQGRTDVATAQERMMERILNWGGVSQAKMVLDLGCGIGGGSIYLLTKLNAAFVTGLTISERQAERAQERAHSLRFASQVRFDVGDALDPPYLPGQFDLVWAIESVEHAADKRKFMESCARMLSPGGMLLMSMWTRREARTQLARSDQRLLDKLSKGFFAPSFETLSAYAAHAKTVGLMDVQTEDWTESVSPFGTSFMRPVLRWRSFKLATHSGWPFVRHLPVLRFLWRGHRTRLLRYGVLQARKPG
ncbi:MAG TPA: SAM-dependent methyltransferase [Bacteroidetes bacterium]|nr:SAM-dependent methyltransferase [Bacteroidota bacterium]HRR08894.1 methyltransferase domain-containing protein [Rhodothermales bacterium]